MMRKGMMKGSGKRGYHNIIGKDPMVHSQSAKGIKQPQKIPLNKLLVGHAPEGDYYHSAEGDFLYTGNKKGDYVNPDKWEKLSSDNLSLPKKEVRTLRLPKPVGKKITTKEEIKWIKQGKKDLDAGWNLSKIRIDLENENPKNVNIDAVLEKLENYKVKV